MIKLLKANFKHAKTASRCNSRYDCKLSIGERSYIGQNNNIRAVGVGIKKRS